jgi:uncharacterized protein YoxC
MRRTYYPAIAVCIAMIMYVLVVYVINNLNSICKGVDTMKKLFSPSK